MKARSNPFPMVLLSAALAFGCGAADDPDRGELIGVHVADVRVDPRTARPVVELLEDGANGRSLSIWVGEFEAESITRAMEHQPSARPNPHDLLKNMLDRIHGHVRRTKVTELHEGTYFAVISGNGAAFLRQDWAKLRKKRWSPERPSRTGAGRPASERR